MLDAPRLPVVVLGPATGALKLRAMGAARVIIDDRGCPAREARRDLGLAAAWPRLLLGAILVN